ncbi:MAG TPA: nucleotidyltransferase [Candidatus Dormibacteraeota bacterium]|nr:nucleotidyltransferase [Candidatus Dormibacteraeota bacterium]
MAWTVAGAFAEFEDTIKPTTIQSGDIQPKINTAHGYLLRAFPANSDMPLWRTVKIGSVAQGTLIRPLDDIDLMAVFDDSRENYINRYQNNSQAFIQRVRAAFNNCRIETVGVRGQAVRLFYQSGASVDIAPVYKWSAGGYILPSGNNSWIRTDPEIQSQWFTTQNQRLDYHLLPMIRLLKRWNNEHGKQLKSYHLSIMVAYVFSSLNNNRADAIAKFFAWSQNNLDVHDPTGYSGNLSSYLTALTRLNLTARLANAATRANSALAAELRGDIREAIRLWRIEFGTEFPTYG